MVLLLGHGEILERHMLATISYIWGPRGRNDLKLKRLWTFLDLLAEFRRNKFSLRCRLHSEWHLLCSDMVESESCHAWVILVWGPGLHFQLLLKLWWYSVLPVLKLWATNWALLFTKEAQRMKTAEWTDYSIRGTLCSWHMLVGSEGRQTACLHNTIIVFLGYTKGCTTKADYKMWWYVFHAQIWQICFYFFTFVLLWFGWKLKMYMQNNVLSSTMSNHITRLSPSAVPCQCSPQCCFSVKSFLICFFHYNNMFLSTKAVSTQLVTWCAACPCLREGTEPVRETESITTFVTATPPPARAWSCQTSYKPHDAHLSGYVVCM